MEISILLRRMIVILTMLFVVSCEFLEAQCCSGGSGSPIGGGSSQGVLQESQAEVNGNFQLVSTDKFLTHSMPAENKSSVPFLGTFNSDYLYSRVAYGLTRDLTISVETRYWFNKKQVSLNNIDTNSASGFGDLILFPRYDIINRTDINTRTELTLGLGFKIPLGRYDDSLAKIEPFSGTVYYQRKPPSVQLSTGAQDFIFYVFYFRGYPDKNLNFFANATYIKKGWNPLGEKFGDYASIGLFTSTKLFDLIGATLQVKGEWVDAMKINKVILVNEFPVYDPEATGSKKVFVCPQIYFNYQGKFTFFISSEFPVFQYVTGTQIASKSQFSAGITYRFYVRANEDGE